MKYNKSSQDQTQTPATASRPTGAANFNPTGIDFAPSADEVARRAYLSYGDQPLLPDHAVQRWFETEAQLLEERNLTWVHGFHSRT